MPIGRNRHEAEIQRCRSNLWAALEELQQVYYEIPETATHCIEELIVAHIEKAFQERLESRKVEVVRRRPS